MNKISTKFYIVILFLFCCNFISAKHGLYFNYLPKVWDEGIPLGNGITGALIWEKEGKLRVALDRADLWDLRPVKQFSGPNYSYKAICDAVEKNDISPIHELIDSRTQKDCAPTKLPVGALEFDMSSLGRIVSTELNVHKALCIIKWDCGATASFFVSATDRMGHFRFNGLPQGIIPQFKTPRFEEDGKDTPPETETRTHLLTSLGYKNGKLKQTSNRIIYKQNVYGDISEEVAIRWNKLENGVLEGVYAITTSGTWYSESYKASDIIDRYKGNFEKAFKNHSKWWENYWEKCSINLPDDPVLERQWYLEMYKFGAASRKGAPPICLQAVWTADNGRTPPWRGDFHNDLNTQLSYWPGYASNHLEESAVFTDWLWNIKSNSEKYTRDFFGVEGLNVPCISTLEGKNIGGWNQYSHQPSTSGWLAHHFYLQWKYSADDEYLKNKAYPWIKEAARYFINISIIGTNGLRKLPLSSSPEINDNTVKAWFKETTNFDLACIRFTFKAASEMAEHLQLKDEAEYWKRQLDEWPDFAVDETGLTIAPDYPLEVSHRHLSNLLAIHPLGLLDVSQGEKVRRLIERSINHFGELGTKAWVGYSFTWFACLQARIFNGDEAARMLHVFTKAFCSPNSFHLNGDQLKKGYSGFTYRPFTLEGNFACASAIQEMLLQSHTGIIRVFPAIPESWRNASFRNMRAEGAFLVSADYENGNVKRIKILSERGGLMKVYHPVLRKVIDRQMRAGEEYVMIF